MIEESDIVDEEQKYSIISHPLRRKIIKHIFQEGSISYTTLSKGWKIKTGPIYYHLNILQPYLSHSENEVYYLNETGLELSQWLFDDGKTKSKIRKLDAFTALFTPIIQRLAFSSVIPKLLYLSVTISLYLTYKLDIIQIGPFLRKNIQFENYSISLLWFNLLVFVLLFGILLVFEKMSIGKPQVQHSFDVYALSLLPTQISVIGLFLIVEYTHWTVSLTYWSVVMIFNQFIFVSINSTGMILKHPSKIERVFLILISILYFSFAFSVYLSLE